MIKHSKVKEKLKNGKRVFGTFVKSTDPAIVEILGYIGFDFVILDNEHIGMGRETLTNMIRACELAQVEPIVRIRHGDKIEILKTLDSGAAGIQVPNVDSQEDLHRVIDSTRYYPEGHRGFATTTRSALYGLVPIPEYVAKTNSETIVISHCETVKSAECLDEQAKIPGVDAFFIGPMDMSQSAGQIGHPEHEEVQKVILNAMKKAKNNNVPFGTVVGDEASLKRYLDLGMQYVVLGSDLSFLIKSAKAMLSLARGG